MNAKPTRFQAINAAAKALHQTVVTLLEKVGISSLDYARVIGTMMANIEPKSIEPDRNSNTYRWMVDQYFAELVKRALPAYERLHDRLVKVGATSEDEEFDVGSDVYIYALNVAEKPTDNSRFSLYSKTLVLRTQRNQYVIVMRCNTFQGACEVHIREFWPDILAVLNGDEHYANTDALEEAADRSDMTIKDLATFGHVLEDVSDDVDGNYDVKRPSLRTFMAGSMIPGDEDAGPTLRFGDARDRGFILSAHAPSLDLEDLKVEDALSANFETVSFVMSTMGFAVETVEDADEEA